MFRRRRPRPHGMWWSYRCPEHGVVFECGLMPHGSPAFGPDACPARGLPFRVGDPAPEPCGKALTVEGWSR